MSRVPISMTTVVVCLWPPPPLLSEEAVRRGEDVYLRNESSMFKLLDIIQIVPWFFVCCGGACIRLCC